jgi:hypothetical protein
MAEHLLVVFLAICKNNFGYILISVGNAGYIVPVMANTRYRIQTDNFALPVVIA